MKVVVLSFRTRRYRSTLNYLAEARRFHQELNHAWTPSLQVGYRDCQRLARRKLGPPGQARPFDLLKIAWSYALGRLPATVIMLPAHVALAGTLSLSIGAEVGYLDAEDVGLSLAQVAIRVSSSKTNTNGRGVRFRWRCTCHCTWSSSRTSATIWMMCVYHLYLDLAVRCDNFAVEKTFKKVGGLPPSLKPVMAPASARRIFRNS